MSPIAPPPRALWIDVARGLGVILVVFGHVLDGLVGARVFPDDALSRGMIYTLYTFHMPLFFFLAGLNVPHSLQRGPGPFLRSKLWTIAYPYVLWSLLQGGVVMMLAASANHPLTAGDLAAIWYRPIAQFWFLYALMLCQLLAALVPQRRVLVAIAAAGLVLFEALPLRSDLALTLHHLPFFVAGICGSRMISEHRARGRAGWMSFAALAPAFAVAVALARALGGPDWNGVAALPACVLGIAGTVVLCQLLAELRPRALARIGVMSMTIYVMHILASSGIRIVLLKLHLPPWPWAYLVIGTAVGITVPMIAHVVLQRCRLLPWFGLAPWPSASRDGRTAAAVASQRVRA